MAARPATKKHRELIAPHLGTMPWVLRVTERADRPAPVFLLKHRKPADDDGGRARLIERGTLYGDSLRRCLPGVRRIIGRVHDENDRPLDLRPFLAGPPVKFRGNLPLDQAAGAKLALLFKLQERVQDLDRVELMALRVDLFSPEEATYWLSRIRHYGRASNRWAAAGMRTMLGGQPGDPEVQRMLADLK